MDPSTVLNLSKPQVVAQTRAGAERQNTAHSTPLTVPGYGLPTGPNGQGQLVEAKAPPGLRGSFRGAVVGQSPVTRGQVNGHNGSRGRGMVNGTPSPQSHLPFRNGPGGRMNGDARGRGNAAHGLGAGRGGPSLNRGGYMAMHRGEESVGVVHNNPNFRAHAQRNVPPPASLSTPNAAGRGGRGGRGGANGARGGRGMVQQRG